MDEFAAILDLDIAKIVAYTLQKLARQRGKAVLAATTDTDLFEDLNTLKPLYSACKNAYCLGFTSARIRVPAHK